MRSRAAGGDHTRRDGIREGIPMTSRGWARSGGGYSRQTWGWTMALCASLGVALKPLRFHHCLPQAPIPHLREYAVFTLGSLPLTDAVAQAWQRRVDISRARAWCQQAQSPPAAASLTGWFPVAQQILYATLDPRRRRLDRLDRSVSLDFPYDRHMYRSALWPARADALPPLAISAVRSLMVARSG